MYIRFNFQHTQIPVLLYESQMYPSMGQLRLIFCYKHLAPHKPKHVQFLVVFMLCAKHGFVHSMDCAAQNMDPRFVR